MFAAYCIESHRIESPHDPSYPNARTGRDDRGDRVQQSRLREIVAARRRASRDETTFDAIRPALRSSATNAPAPDAIGNVPASRAASPRISRACSLERCRSIRISGRGPAGRSA
ncbi:hypothetical protein WS91_19500 [Burkholderia sp. MSMB1498]|nr:hypothetical protein WS91_19500 [Burkholderia sp. MSMB1498]